jgi:hypothetical protein
MGLKNRVKGGSMGEQFLIVPNFKVMVGTNDFLVSSFCFKDQIQWVWRANIAEGYSDSYVSTCACCGGDCLAYGDKKTITSDNEIEVVGWLAEQKDELLLVILESTSSTERSVLQKIIEQHDFSGWYSKIKTIQSSESFPLRSKRSLKKRLTSGTLLQKYSVKKTLKQNKKSEEEKNKKNQSEKKSTAEEKKPFLKSSKKKTRDFSKQLLSKLKSIARGEKSAGSLKNRRKSFEVYQIGRMSRESIKCAATSSAKEFQYTLNRNIPLQALCRNVFSQNSQPMESEQKSKKSKSSRRKASHSKSGGQSKATQETPSQSPKNVESQRRTTYGR